jgi:hypothetical protein
MGDFVVCFKSWWNKTSSVDFQVYLVNLKEDTITGLKFDIEIGCTDYSTSLMRWVYLSLSMIQHLQRAETSWSENSFEGVMRLL